MNKRKLSKVFKPLIIVGAIVIVAIASFGSCKKELEKSNASDILKFVLKEQTDSAKIDKTNKKVEITVSYSTNLTKIAPSVEVSLGATLAPKSGDTVNFSSGVVDYVVTAENSTTSTWKVYVTKEEEISKKIVSFSLTGQVSPAVITDSTIKLSVIRGTDMTKLKPTITVTEGSIIKPSSGETVDFSKGPINFLVTASDGSSKSWVVEISQQLSAENKIISVSIPGQVGDVVIIDTTFSFSVLANIDVKTIKPAITISDGATIDPAIGTEVDFSRGYVDYTITAEDGSKAIYRIFVTIKQFTADDSNIKYVGRVDFANPKNPKFSNPGVYIVAKFTGTFCDMLIQGDNTMHYVQVVIDNKAPKRLALPGKKTAIRVADSLPEGEHTILICKETEAGVGSVIFYGFRCAGLVPVTDMPTRKIECYGNSITCGAKMLFGNPCDLTNNGTNWNAANSAYLSYGAVTARALNAQWQITAVSGIGLISSCCGMTNKMPDTYDRLDLNNTSKKWDFKKYIPDVVTICLGQNDGATIVASKEFKDKYVEFINTIRSKYSDASIFCVTSPMADSSKSSSCLFKVMQKSLVSIVDSVNNAGDEKVYWVSLPHDQNQGCPGQGHPSEAEHLKTAGVLEAVIKDKMGW